MLLQAAESAVICRLTAEAGEGKGGGDRAGKALFEMAQVCRRTAEPKQKASGTGDQKETEEEEKLQKAKQDE